MNDTTRVVLGTTMSFVESQSIAERYAPWVFAIIVIVLSFLLGILVYFFYSGQFRTQAKARRIVLVHVFALIVAVFTSFLAVVVSVGPTSPSEFKFSVLGLTISLVGPPAIYMAASWFMTRKTNQDIGEDEANLDARIIQAEQRLGWVDYYSWKEQVGRFKDVIGDLEIYFIEDLLPKVYYHGQTQFRRPQSPEIATLFVYSSEGILKLQRIQGRYAGEGERPRIYLPSTASTPGGTIRSVHCFREGGHLTEIAIHRHGEWKATTSDAIDCLICTVYENDKLSLGDYLYVDTTKYLRYNSVESGLVSLAVVSAQPLKNLRAWELKASSAGAALPVPLILRELRRKPLAGKNAIESITSEFDQWIRMLRTTNLKAICSPQDVWSDVSPVFAEAWKILGGEASPGEQLPRAMDGSRSPHKYVFDLVRVNSVIITTLEWDIVHPAEVPEVGALIDSASHAKEPGKQLPG